MRLSLILPIYNVEKYLPDCLQSLLEQDLPPNEYEIVCVIDGSPDHSADVIRKWQKQYPNIVLVEQENAGVSAARNRGFEKAQGKYVWFIDPDDMLRGQCLQKICDTMEAYHADVFEMDYATCDEHAHYREGSGDFQIAGKNKEGSSGSGWLAVCLSSYLKKNHIQWNENLKYGEDYLWALQVKYRKHTSIYTNEKLYLYRQRQGSAMTTATLAKIERQSQDMLTLHDEYAKEIERCEKNELPQWMITNLKYRRQLCVQAALVNILKMRLSDKQIRERLSVMRRKGQYPYPLMLWNIFTKNAMGSRIQNIAYLFFPCEWYYRGVNAAHKHLTHG